MRIRHRGRSFLVLIPGTNHTITILDGEQDVPDHIGEQLVRQGRVDPVYLTPPDDDPPIVGAGFKPAPTGPFVPTDDPNVAPPAAPYPQPGAPLAEPPSQPAEVPTSSSARSRRRNIAVDDD